MEDEFFDWTWVADEETPAVINVEETESEVEDSSESESVEILRDTLVEADCVPDIDSNRVLVPVHRANRWNDLAEAVIVCGAIFVLIAGAAMSAFIVVGNKNRELEVLRLSTGQLNEVILTLQSEIMKSSGRFPSVNKKSTENDMSGSNSSALYPEMVLTSISSQLTLLVDSVKADIQRQMDQQIDRISKEIKMDLYQKICQGNGNKWLDCPFSDSNLNVADGENAQVTSVSSMLARAFDSTIRSTVDNWNIFKSNVDPKFIIDKSHSFVKTLIKDINHEFKKRNKFNGKTKKGKRHGKETKDSKNKKESKKSDNLEKMRKNQPLDNEHKKGGSHKSHFTHCRKAKFALNKEKQKYRMLFQKYSSVIEQLNEMKYTNSCQIICESKNQTEEVGMNWLLQLGQQRGGLRWEHSRGDWVFERARARRVAVRKSYQ